MQKSRTEIKCAVKGYPLHGLTEAVYVVEWVFLYQFSYCPLVWMFHSRGKNNTINRLHERYLRLIYSDKISDFIELLENDDSVSIHKRNLRLLATGMFKLKRFGPYTI